MKSSKSSCISNWYNSLVYVDNANRYITTGSLRNSMQKSGKILWGRKDTLAPVVSTLRGASAPTIPTPMPSTEKIWQIQPYITELNLTHCTIRRRRSEFGCLWFLQIRAMASDVLRHFRVCSTSNVDPYVVVVTRVPSSYLQSAPLMVSAIATSVECGFTRAKHHAICASPFIPNALQVTVACRHILWDSQTDFLELIPSPKWPILCRVGR